MKTFVAIILNIFYPGAGYLYLKDDFRMTIAKFLVFCWTLVIFGVTSQLIGQAIDGNVSIINTDFSIPPLAVGMWCFMIYDTLKVVREKVAKTEEATRGYSTLSILLLGICSGFLFAVSGGVSNAAAAITALIFIPIILLTHWGKKRK
jgi:hypothetical protein